MLLSSQGCPSDTCRNEELTNPIVDGIIKNKGAESMKQYQFLLFDADGTLLDFDRCEEKALRDTLLSFGIPDCQETLRSYHQINAALWNVLMQEKLTGRICCTAGLSSCVNSWAGRTILL